MFVSITVRQSSASTWCGAGKRGRSALQLAHSRSAPLICGAVIRSIGAFSQTAAAYQITRMAAMIMSTGPVLPRHRRAKGWRACPAIAASDVIGMPRPQSLPHTMRDRQKLRGFASIERAAARQITVNHVNDAPRTRRHDNDAGGKKHGFGDGVGDEDHRLLGLVPELEKLEIQTVADDFIER